MEKIAINELIDILNKKINSLISFERKFDVFLQKGGVGCYDTRKWAIFVPDTFDTNNQISIILHESAHLILREKLSKKIEPRKFDRLKWGMEPFFIDNSIFAIDESFAEIITTMIISQLPEELFKKTIVFDKVSEPSYEDSEKKLDMFLAKISTWKIPITLKNNNLNIANTLSNLTFLKPKERIKILLNAFPDFRDLNHESFINEIIKNPKNYSPTIRLASKIVNLHINGEFKEFDKQIFLDYLEIISWLNYTEDYYIYNNYLAKTNSKKIEIKKIKLDIKLKKKLSKISPKLQEVRRKLIGAWKDKEEESVKKLVEEYNDIRWQYREKIDLKNDFNKFGFGMFKK